jgi:hypothetical protein
VRQNAFWLATIMSQTPRQDQVDNNYVETVISLAPNLFFGTSIAVNIDVVLYSIEHGVQERIIEVNNIQIS